LKPEDLLTRIRQRNFANISFSDFCALAEEVGFELARVSGSHHIYRHAGIPRELNLQPDASRHAKPYQVRQFLRLVEAYTLHLRALDD
jgi:predicted RNA binding protein YcfA (HicA-like mRNA interferase family)